MSGAGGGGSCGRITLELARSCQRTVAGSRSGRAKPSRVRACEALGSMETDRSWHPSHGVPGGVAVISRRLPADKIPACGGFGISRAMRGRFGVRGWGERKEVVWPARLGRDASRYGTGAEAPPMRGHQRNSAVCPEASTHPGLACAATVGRIVPIRPGCGSLVPHAHFLHGCFDPLRMERRGKTPRCRVRSFQHRGSEAPLGWQFRGRLRGGDANGMRWQW